MPGSKKILQKNFFQIANDLRIGRGLSDLGLMSFGNVVWKTHRRGVANKIWNDNMTISWLWLFYERCQFSQWYTKFREKNMLIHNYQIKIVKGSQLYFVLLAIIINILSVVPLRDKNHKANTKTNRKLFQSGWR